MRRETIEERERRRWRLGLPPTMPGDTPCPLGVRCGGEPGDQTGEPRWVETRWERFGSPGDWVVERVPELWPPCLVSAPAWMGRSWPRLGAHLCELALSAGAECQLDMTGRALAFMGQLEKTLGGRPWPSSLDALLLRILEGSGRG